MAVACRTAFADSTEVKSLIQRMIGTVGSLYNTMTIIFIVCGILITAKSLMGMYQLSANEQQASPPIGCIVGLLVGGALTVVGVVAAIVANSLE